MLSVETLAEVGEWFASVAGRRELRARLDRAEIDVVEALGTASLAEAEGLLRDLDRGHVKTCLAEAEVLLEGHERAEAEAYAAHRRAVDRIAEVVDDEEVARIAGKRSTVLLEIEQRVAACLRLRLGVLAAEAAIGMFRDEHKSGWMTAASRAFSALTAGSFARLTSRSERTGETLIAVTGAGCPRTAIELSKGTRIQLYLAPRIPAYKEYVRSREPCRSWRTTFLRRSTTSARARRSAFACMAESGQVIYLTHHPPILSIASAVCPDVRIHELAPLPVV